MSEFSVHEFVDISAPSIHRVVLRILYDFIFFEELPFIVAIFLNIFVTKCQSTSRNALCAVYDPFKFQVGGAFPLHDTDCVRLRPKTVQDIVAIQWALTHWNQNPANSDAKLGLFISMLNTSLHLSSHAAVKYHVPLKLVKNQCTTCGCWKVEQ
ncbi:unnamed protein product [Anisakis simplex]|uniref:CELF35-1 (inferred by orthology to a C. elegans protein) n=1 Tax=Anisakis simplex TaxID=6269 RepID=A0A0M3J2T9_ANISI|nr:unnamed protein product [Anisakis simplex]